MFSDGEPSTNKKYLKEDDLDWRQEAKMMLVQKETFVNTG
jgi:hypothetical protein